MAAEQVTALVGLDATGDDEQIHRAVAVHVDEKGGHGLALDGVVPGLLQAGPGEVPRAVVQVKRATAARCAGEEQVGVTVAIGVTPGKAAAEGVHAVGQEGLALHVVEDALLVDEIEPELAGLVAQQAVIRGPAGHRGRRMGDLGGRFVDDVVLVGGQVIEFLHLPVGPVNLQLADRLALTQPEMEDRLGRGERAARHGEPAHLRALFGLGQDEGADAVTVAHRTLEPERDAVARGAVVAIEADPILVVDIDEIEVAVVVEVGEGRPEAHAAVVEAPFLLDLGETEIVVVAEGEVRFLLGRLPLHQRDDFRGGLQLFDLVEQVGINEGPHHAVGHVQVDPAVVVEVLETRRPAPVGAAETGHLRDLEEAVGPGVQEHGVLHVLRRDERIHHVHEAAHVTHGDLGLEVRGAGHLRDHEVGQAVVVDVGGVGAHREPRRVRHGRGQDAGERAVAVVAVEAVRGREVVRDVEVGPAVAVVVEPGGRVAVGRLARDAGLGGNLVEGPVPPVVVEAGRLAVGGAGGVRDVREHEEVKVAVAVVVLEGPDHAARHEVHACRVGRLLEVAVAVVQVKQVGRVEAADVDVEEAVAVHVGHRRAGLPAGAVGGGRARDAGRGRDVDELEGRDLPEELGRARLVRHEDIREPVAIDVTDGEAGPHRPGGELEVARAPHRRVVVGILVHQARLGGGNGGEPHFLPGAALLGQRRGGDLGRGLRVEQQGAGRREQRGAKEVDR